MQGMQNMQGMQGMQGPGMGMPAMPPGFPYPMQQMQMQQQMGMGMMGNMGAMDRDTSRNLVQRQVEYYFSAENLQKDMYLRQQMNEQGWVNIHIIAGFNRLRKLL